MAQRDPDALELALAFGLEGLKSRVSELYDEVRGHSTEEWTGLSPEGLAGVWKSLYTTHFTSSLKRRIPDLPELIALRTFLTNLVDVEKAADARRNDILVALADVASARDLYVACAALRDTAMIKGLTKKHFADEQQYARFKDTCADARGVLDGIAAFAAYDPAAALPAAKLGLHGLRLALRIGAAYDQRKRDENGLDFTDLQLRQRDLLLDPANQALVKRLGQDLRLMLVDECQDTDPVQIEILRALSGEGNKLFVVGDYKQSIYRFRGADPSVFLALRQATPPQGRLPLSKNFRSQPGVLHFVNALFADALSTESEPYEPLQAARANVGAGANVEFLWPPGDAARGATYENRRTEARWIAQRLRAILDSGEKLIDDPREGPCAVHPGDIAILFRALSNVQLYEDALREAGIPYYLVGGHAFYAQQEIFDLVNLLRAVHSPADEIALAGALRSPIFGLTDESLFRLMREGKTLAAGLTNRETWRGFVTAEQTGPVERAATTIERLRAIKDRVSIAELIRSALEWTGYDAALVAEFLGERKLANLEKLIDMARVFDRSGTMGLGDFLTQLSDYVSAEPKESLAATHPENSKVVKLMTIHKSKGLEFPLVVVPDLGRAKRGGGPRRGVRSAVGSVGPTGRRRSERRVGRHGLSQRDALLGRRGRVVTVVLRRRDARGRLLDAVGADSRFGKPARRLVAVVGRAVRSANRTPARRYRRGTMRRRSWRRRSNRRRPKTARVANRPLGANAWADCATRSKSPVKRTRSIAWCATYRPTRPRGNGFRSRGYPIN
ncbi:MAG: UvrD-helicase domain-containing protein [Pirellulales bacterium]